MDLLKEIGIYCFVFAIIIISAISFIQCAQAETERRESIEIQCEHEFITTSKYNWLLNSYKTYSKCLKCGMEI